MKFRKKPVVIEAMQLLRADENEVRAWIEGNGGECLSWLKPSIGGHQGFLGLHIATLEGQMSMSASYGDWIIRGVKGEFYPCKPDIFEETYESVEQPERGD